MRNTLAALLLAATTMLCTVAVQAQEYWSTVPAPSGAPVCTTERKRDPITNELTNELSPTHLSNYVWRYPFTKPIPGGRYAISNACFDGDGKIGAWSTEAILDLKSGWNLSGGSWNQQVYEDACGIAWRVRCISIIPADDFAGNPYQAGTEWYYYTGWGGSFVENDIAPYSGHSPYLQQLQSVNVYTLNKFPSGGKHTTVAPAPPVLLTQVPNCNAQIAWCRVTETGETALSAPYEYVVPTYPAGTTKAETISLNFSIGEFHPQGTLGYHVYYRAGGVGRWRRVPAPHCLGIPATADDWLFPRWQRQFSVSRIIGNAPGHNPPAEAKSRLSWVHRMLRGDPVKDYDVLLPYLKLRDDVKVVDGVTTVTPIYDPNYVAVVLGVPIITRVYVGDVICPAGSVFEVTCPVVDEWGNGDSGTTGAPPDQKFHRRIRSMTSGGWIIRAATSQGGHTSWPTVEVNNQYSRWIGCTITSNGGDAMATSDYSGGQAFGNQLIECILSAAAIPGRVTCGLRIDSRSSFYAGGHTASEWKIRDCGIIGSIAMYFDGNQTANISADRLHANSYAHDPRGCVMYIGCPSPFNFNEVYCDAFNYGNSDFISANNARGTIIKTAGNVVRLEVNRIWVDTGFTRFVDSDRCMVQLRLRSGKLNVRGQRPALALFVGTIGQPPSWAPPNSPGEVVTWLIEDTGTQPDPGTEHPRVISSTYRLFNPLTERTPLTKLILQEPGETVATSRLQRFAGSSAQLHPREMPGYKIPSAGGILTINSLTTGLPVARDNGKVIPVIVTP